MPSLKPFHQDFDFDLAEALAEQLVETFDTMEIGALTTDNITKVRRDKGLYLLYKGADVIYVGKADSEHLRTRLSKHYHKVRGRRGIDVTQMGFKCLYLHRNWRPVGSERLLIDMYKEQCQAGWNGMSFGPNDPGREREKTDLRLEGFDQNYPIDLDWVCEGVRQGPRKAEVLLAEVKTELPYVFRYQADGHFRNGHPDYNGIEIEVPRDSMTAQELMELVAQSIPDARVTVFPSHIIMYLNDDSTYPHGRTIQPEA